MRLVRGSILDSRPCSTSKAARILRRFLCSDGGTDVSIKTFLKSAARSLESMRGEEPGHSKRKKSRLDPEKSENPNEWISETEPREEASVLKTEDADNSEKREKYSNDFSESLPNEKVGVGAPSIAGKLAKISKKKPIIEGETELKMEVDAELANVGYTTPVLQRKAEKRWRANGVASTSAQEEGKTEKKRKKEKKHSHKENYEGGLSDLQGKEELGLKETPATHNKSEKARPVSEDNDLSLSNSKRSEQGQHQYSVGDQRHPLKRKMAEAADEGFADGQELHFTKKKRKDKTPKYTAEEDIRLFLRQKKI